MRLQELIESSRKTRRDIIITLPASNSWEDYQRELDTVADGSQVMRFKVNHFPKEAGEGSKCYLCYQGNIVGWMPIVGFHEGDFTCSTTGRTWSGKFIERSGKFNTIDPIPYKGFQGWRYYTEPVNESVQAADNLISQNRNDPYVDLVLNKIDDDRVELETLYVHGPKRGLGLANAAMKSLCHSADELGVTIELEPIPRERDVSKKQLIQFYSKFGFQIDSVSGWMVRTPKNMIHENSELSFRIEVSGFHNGQMDAELLAIKDGRVVGGIEYSVYEDEPYIQMITVNPAYRRQGIGKALMKRLQQEYPDKQIVGKAMRTDDGEMLNRSLKTREVIDHELKAKFDELEALKAKEEDYTKRAEEWRQAGPHSEKERLKFIDSVSDWNDLHYQLEQELEGKSYSKILIDESGLKFTDAFWRWFKGSKVVDSKGNPLMVFHGTKNPPVEFEPSRIGTGSSVFGNYQVERYGIFVTPDPKLAADFANAGGSDGASIMPLYASIKNPLDMVNNTYSVDLYSKVENEVNKKDNNGHRVASLLGEYWGSWELFDDDNDNYPEDWIELFKNLGFDGAIIREEPNGIAYVAFDPNQIKSIFNSTYRTDSNKINESETLSLPDIEVGDEVLTGKFKNKRVKVTGFTKDKHEQPVLKTTKGEEKLFKPRLTKLMKEDSEEGVGTFVGARLTDKSASKLHKWMVDNIPNCLSKDKLHITIIVDVEKDIDWMPLNYDKPIRIDPESYRFELLGENKDILVLRVDCPELEKRHEWGKKKYKVDTKFPDYKPHISMSYEPVDDIDEDLMVPDFPLYLEKEYVEPFSKLDESTQLYERYANYHDQYNAGPNALVVQQLKGIVKKDKRLMLLLKKAQKSTNWYAAIQFAEELCDKMGLKNGQRDKVRELAMTHIVRDFSDLTSKPPVSKSIAGKFKSMLRLGEAMELMELFNRAYEFHWLNKEQIKKVYYELDDTLISFDHVAMSKFGDTVYLFVLSRAGNGFQYNFGPVQNGSFHTVLQDDAPTGFVFAILTTALAVAVDFIQKRQPPFIEFSASVEALGRIYAGMAKRMLNKLPTYQAAMNSDDYTLILYDPRKVQIDPVDYDTPIESK